MLGEVMEGVEAHKLRRGTICVGAEDRKGVQVEMCRKHAGMRVKKWETSFGHV
jgi:hypothetical protein